MRKLIFISLFLLINYSINAQSFWVTDNNAFDTNGPIGECLFPMDEHGETEYKEVIALLYCPN